MTARKSSPLGQRKSAARSRVTVRGSGSSKKKPPLAKASKVPPGAYRSTICSIKEVKTTAGDEAVEVIYELAAPDGRQLQMREIIPIDSWPFERFCDALIEAGLNEDDDLTAAVGISEDVELHYPEPKGFGRFKTRTPVTASVESQTEKPPSTATGGSEGFAEDNDNDEDFDEFDDFLDDEDE